MWWWWVFFLAGNCFFLLWSCSRLSHPVLGALFCPLGHSLHQCLTSSKLLEVVNIFFKTGELLDLLRSVSCLPSYLLSMHNAQSWWVWLLLSYKCFCCCLFYVSLQICTCSQYLSGLLCCFGSFRVLLCHLMIQHSFCRFFHFSAILIQCLIHLHSLGCFFFQLYIQLVNFPLSKYYKLLELLQCSFFIFPCWLS